MGVLLNFDMGKIFLSKLEKVKQKYPAHLRASVSEAPCLNWDYK
jgi:hypothetical protein